ncbi:MAG TPA: hypothetical protein PL124_12510 [Candidatus Cloacimonadota bacterium]|nr:hypothetical protein [Candidatus Cloacimonadota bacterium]
MMADAVNIELEGFDKMSFLFKNYEKEANRVVKSSLRKGANEVKKAQAASLPPEIKSLKSVLRVISVKKELLVLAGVFARGKQYVNSRGVKWSPWNLIYWLNYGTYAGRYSGHAFITARKARTASRQGGIQGTAFLDKATERAMPAAADKFEKDAEVKLDALLKKLTS